MRKTFIWATLLLVLCTGTSCIRTMGEMSGRIPPSERCYAGTRNVFIFPSIAGAMSAGSHSHSGASNPVGTAAFYSLLLLDLPIEFALDTVLLPLDIVIYSCYCIRPPLDKYFYDNDLSGMKAQLEKGADPNAVTPWFKVRRPLLLTAYYTGKEDFFRLLLDHGAKILFEIPQSYDNQKSGMIKYAFKNGCPEELLEHPKAKFVISDIILQNLEYPYKASPDDKSLVDVLTMLMDFGFPPHEWDMTKGGRPSMQTPLDVVMANEAMETEAKDRLVAAMMAHGAKSYAETNHLKSSDKHLQIDGMAILPMFQPVVDVFKASSHADLFRISDSYDSVDGPVLVIDKPLIHDVLHGDSYQKETLYRQKIPFRRRISQTEWSPGIEYLDVPAEYRVVLTPPGKRLPSRRPQGMPSQRGFWEAWFTLPTCELYVEHAMHCGNWPDKDLLKACLLHMQLKNDRDLLRRLIYAPSEVEPSIMDAIGWPAKHNYNDGSPLDKLNWNATRNPGTYQITKEVEKWLSQATEELQRLGISAKWRLASGYDASMSYTFSTHRDLSEVRLESLPLAPHPEEIIVIIHRRDLQHSYPVVEHPWGYEGKDYWNWEIHQPSYRIKTKHIRGTVHGDIFLYYGDSVTKERLDALRHALEKLFK